MPPQTSDIKDDVGTTSTVQLSVYQYEPGKRLREGRNEPQQEVKDTIEESEQEEEQVGPWYKRAWNWWCNFYAANSFLVGVVIAILLALAYPPLGADYLQPQITATWIAVIFIFLMAGLGLKTEELSKAFLRIYFNGFVQIFNFGVVSAIVFGFSRLMKTAGALNSSLADGMVICSCLPLTINMVMVLTKSAGGDEAAAIFNAAFGNLIGVFLSPVLILAYIGVTGDIDIGTVFYKLALRVLTPLLVGQILQKKSKTVVDFVKKYKPRFKKAQELTLIFIVYTVFCRTFDNGTDSTFGDVVIMICFQGFLLCLVMILAWFALRFLFPNDPKLRVMGLFGCTHKTVAMGVPLINAIYESDSNVGLYTLPLLIWHPMQLIIGSALVPRLAAFVEREEERLGIDKKEEEGVDEASGDEESSPGTRDDGDEEALDPVDEEEGSIAEIDDESPKEVTADEENSSPDDNDEEAPKKVEADEEAPDESR